MDSEEIIRMAREACDAEAEDPLQEGGMLILSTDELSRLMDAVIAGAVAAEREECAAICDRMRAVTAVSYETGSACAAAIRARGATDGKPT